MIVSVALLSSPCATTFATLSTKDLAPDTVIESGVNIGVAT